ncbi:putative orphan protein [Pseudoalteromonas translucida]|uniref:Orphan protein n=1 Tax=Pseudoalteromonas translucida (strain TAC 125) TaxID=326442 RepID=Q3IHS6_PSET1|nr:putative orphan protein [Pseudoalteromonas translucida]
MTFINKILTIATYFQGACLIPLYTFQSIEINSKIIGKLVRFQDDNNPNTAPATVKY